MSDLQYIPKEYKAIINPFIKSGQLTVVRGRHVCLVAASGHKQPVPGTPSDGRSFQNWRKHFRDFLKKSNIEATI